MNALPGQLELATAIDHQKSFSKEELNLFRKWFEAMEDLSQEYQDKPGCDLYWKVMELLK